MNKNIPLVRTDPFTMNQNSSKILTEEDVKLLAKAGEMVLAVDMYRQIHNVGMKQAFDAVKNLAGLPPSVPRKSSLPLSIETQRRLEVIFRLEHRAEATRLLIEECGNNLPFCEKNDEVGMERIRFAVLKLSGGDMLKLNKAIQAAKLDWRDMLCWAGFADDVQAYKHWFPAKTD